MIIVKSGPKNKTKVQEALRLLVTLAGTNFPTLMIFLGDGVNCLRPKAIEDLNIRDYLQAASDLSEIFVHSVSEKMIGLGKDVFDHEIFVNPLDIDELTKMIRGCDSVAVY